MRHPDHVRAIKDKALELGCEVLSVTRGGSGNWLVLIARGGKQVKVSASSSPSGMCLKKAVREAIRWISTLPKACLI